MVSKEVTGLWRAHVTLTRLNQRDATTPVVIWDSDSQAFQKRPSTPTSFFNTVLILHAHRSGRQFDQHSPTTAMQTRSRSTRSSVLGKRAHQTDTPSPSSNTLCEPPTPDQTPNPKRPRVSLTGLDGDGNKENVPPLRGEIANGDSSPSMSRRPSPSLRRTSTELMTPSRSRQGRLIIYG